jgi:hypothetical protein
VKKIVLLFLIVFGALICLIYYLSAHDLFGWRLNFSFSRVKMNEYRSFGPDLSFKYPDTFEIDADPENRYGDNYVVGIKLRTDNRTGCDIRSGGPSLDYTKSIDESTQGVIDSIKEKSKDFKLIERQKIKISGRDGLKISFSFLDPIGARVRLDQISTQKGEVNYLIICGAGEYQFELFQKDFGKLYETLSL